MQFNILERRAGYVSYSFHCLTIETEKYTNENSFIENLAALKYSMCHREANKCNNKKITIHVSCSEEELPCCVKM